MSDEALLSNGGNQLALACKNRASGKAASATGKGAILGVEQPIIGAKGAVKPERVVKACGLHFTLEDRSTMRNQG